MRTHFQSLSVGRQPGRRQHQLEGQREHLVTLQRQPGGCLQRLQHVRGFGTRQQGALAALQQGDLGCSIRGVRE